MGRPSKQYLQSFSSHRGSKTGLEQNFHNSINNQLQMILIIHLLLDYFILLFLWFYPLDTLAT